MTKRNFVLTVVLAIVDTLISALAILAFAWGSWNYGKWWILCFTLIPLVLFHAHPIVNISDEEVGEKNS